METRFAESGRSHKFASIMNTPTTLPMLLLALLATGSTMAQITTEPRARDLGIPLEGTPGTHNAITDVPGIEVGYTTLISGDGLLEYGKGPVRTGVTVILPKGRTPRAIPRPGSR